ncbi:hypothetical protein EMCG_04999 [[Emmonsia] crescens]|uniref:Uncharacterized protein n=1 Tax=[Emmonsia] crescens TaxID=73230 RepID=A0A0G2HQ92_9EURO|nr:hypothetical protein EMCG_04999 [Emmonsia crescens UAMH 3008]
MAFYRPRFVRGAYIGLDPPFSFNMQRGSGHPMAIDREVIYALPGPSLFREERRPLINIDRETIYHPTAPSPASFNKEQGSSPENPIDIDGDVNGYHGLPSIQQPFPGDFDHSYRNTPGSTPQNPIDLEKETQEEVQGQLCQNCSQQTEAVDEVTLLNYGMIYAHLQ